ncbi:LysM domain-containing protein, partial [bacterium]|nr:LysM domain-containing protein [bacterium]
LRRPVRATATASVAGSTTGLATVATSSTTGDVGYATSAGAAPVATGPTALPEMGSKMAYYVMRGDTLGAIAQKIFGSRKKWKALQTENGLADANKIYPGDVIYFTLDASSKAFAEKYEIGNRQAYTIAKGDTLSRLAAKFYGTQGAWRALWKENPQILNPDRIRVGTVLSYRATSKVALKDEREDEGEVKEEDNETANAGNDEGGTAMDDSVGMQFTAAAE